MRLLPIVLGKFWIMIQALHIMKYVVQNTVPLAHPPLRMVGPNPSWQGGRWELEGMILLADAGSFSKSKDDWTSKDVSEDSETPPFVFFFQNMGDVQWRSR